MNQLQITNDMPRRLKFRGKLVLNPGPNDVDEKVFLEVWQSDPTLKFYWAQAGLLVERDGKEFTPPDAPARERVLPAALQGRALPLPTAELRPPEDAPEEPAEEPTEQPEATPMGGGNVPGNAKQAKASVRNMWDVETLEGWASNESRSSVLGAIEEQLRLVDDAVNADDSD